MTTKEVLHRLTTQGLLEQDDYIRLTAHEEERRKADRMKGRLVRSGYVSLTELAKEHGHALASEVVHAWIRHRTTIAFLIQWEQKSNSLFQPLSDERCKAVTPKRWIKETGAIGIRCKQGHGGGIWAHPEIACDFLMWLSPSFRAEVIAAYHSLIAEVSR